MRLRLRFSHVKIPHFNQVTVCVHARVRNTHTRMHTETHPHTHPGAGMRDCPQITDTNAHIGTHTEYTHKYFQLKLRKMTVKHR